MSTLYFKVSVSLDDDVVDMATDKSVPPLPTKPSAELSFGIEFVQSDSLPDSLENNGAPSVPPDPSDPDLRAKAPELALNMCVTEKDLATILESISLDFLLYLVQIQFIIV